MAISLITPLPALSVIKCFPDVAKYILKNAARLWAGKSEAGSHYFTVFFVCITLGGWKAVLCSRGERCPSGFLTCGQPFPMGLALLLLP